MDKNEDQKPDEEQTLTITFEAGDGSFVDDQTYSYNVLPGEDYPVAPSKEQIVAPEGQAFRYFADEEGQAYDLTGKVPADQQTATLTYTAVYGVDSNGDGTADEDEEKYTISYEAGTDDEVANMPATQTNVLKNTTQTVSTQVPTRKGYVFSGWTTDDVTVEDGEFKMPNHNVTFTATWKVDKNEDGIPDEDQNLNKPEDSDSDKDSEKTDGEDTAAATNVGIFASLATSALAGMGILTALKKRRKN